MTRRMVLAVLGVAAICLVLLGLVWWWRDASPPAPSVSDLHQLGSLRVTGVGYLENDQAGQSVAAFQQLIQAFPEQPLGYRNLAVAQLMILQSVDRSAEADRWQEVYTQTEQAVQALLAADPQAAETHILAARVAAAAGDLTAAAAHYQTALQSAPPAAHAPIWFESYRLEQHSNSPQSHDALCAAVAAAPRNSAALLEWLRVQAETREESIVETLAQTREVLAPLSPSIEQRVRVSLLELIDNAQQSAAAADWEGVNRWVRMIVNVTRPEELVRSDLGQLDRNVLEFVIIDFPDAFYERYALQRVQPSAPIPVSFVEDQSSSLPEHADLLDFTVGDFDLDGVPDLIVLSEQQVQVWSRAAGEPTWSILASHDLDKPYRSLLAVDLDADVVVGSAAAEGGLQPSADLDLVLFGPQGWIILENQLQADQTRQLVRRELAVAAEPILTVATGDFDLDGDLDLFVSAASGVSVWANRGELRFEPWEAEALIGAADLRPTQVIVVDWDRDADVDLLLAGADGGPVGYLENLRHSRMRWQPLDEMFELASGAAQLAIDDVDGNASWDLLACGADGCQLITTQTPTAGRVLAHDRRALSPPVSGILTQLDYDNDGALDLLVQQQDGLVLLRHLGSGEYQRQAVLPEDLHSVTAAQAADLDRDGDLDLITLRDGRLQILSNEGGNANGWIDVVLLAQQVKGTDAQASGRVNSYGLGSLLELKSGTTYQSRVVQSTSTHFGIGQQNRADVVRVVWTNGVPQNVIEPAGNQTITEQQTLKGSCPYLYAWSGEGYTFVTDLLWSAPLGLQTAAGTIAPDRPWEYLKIDGDALQAIDGEYRLQITEELWEAAYFDHVSLIAVDHPADIEIFTNEKVGPAELAQPKLHIVAQRQVPQAATDSQGRDVLSWIAAEDDQYLKAYEHKFCQGYVSDHYVEIDLGKLESNEQLTLFLAGWIYPTDTSLNVQLSQDPTRPGPRPPYLMAPDAQGQWREVKDFMGFPGGKTKTIAVDLSEIDFAGDDYRLRICTSAEIYWDAIFFTHQPPQVELIEQPLVLRSADLHARGVSQRIEHPGNGPERYDYQSVLQEPAWPPMKGNFTRFGDVTELVAEVDDHLVVMGTGDEMTLRFVAPPEPPPAGWRRDFVLHCWGWDKDGDLNTIYGETAEPLPYREMESYPVAADRKRPDSPAYQRYLQQYQTRQQASGPFRNAVRVSGDQGAGWLATSP